MHLIMFDIDGTLVESYDFDTECFQAAIRDVLGIAIGSDWSCYRHVTDSGILAEIVAESGFHSDRERIEAKVKEQFVSRVADYISCHEVSPIPGAYNFLSQLVSRQNVSVAFATGGWAESARMKLNAAGLSFPSIPLASSSDHNSRIEIMRLAERLVGTDHYDSRTYFGDGPWDQKASETLGYNFISVGHRISSLQSIRDYTEADVALRYIGL
ncbi:Phosphoglycolate phosphatase, HAD superfamily [Amphritea atlantica]|uniref:Phosphoglycolate phosphatase, HAD superfamily n=1 Tax=Amphritea atlantica TaxID=355243 RepID=A0A1H9KUA8_9GAMM|nr:HAD family hydrolase [Amphritea atlantica]SER02477.1 Phosphoglycolate phosphatase, HAD superfamily [Amphritea atlantica]